MGYTPDNTIYTEEDANRVIKELDETVPVRIWCPLTAMACRIDCICYSPARKHELQKYDKETAGYKGNGEFKIYGGTCGNYMFGE